MRTSATVMASGVLWLRVWAYYDCSNMRTSTAATGVLRLRPRANVGCTTLTFLMGIYAVYVLYVLPAYCITLINILFVLTALPCGTPSSLSNGQRHYTSATVGSTVTYTCNTGYLMTAGNSSRTCLFGGRWSASHPTCSSEFTLVTFIIFATWLSRG